MTRPTLNPPHYNEMNLPFMKGAGLLRGFCLGNAVKYIDRAGKKEGDDEQTDILKAIEYLTLYLEYKEFIVRPVRDRGEISERLSAILGPSEELRKSQFEARSLLHPHVSNIVNDADKAS